MVHKNTGTDDELRQHIRSLLKQDKDLRGYGLNAGVVEGEVQLQGIVETLSEKKRAEELVRQVPGVKGVVNALTISTDGAISGRDVTMEVQEELELEPNVDLRHIGAESVGGHGAVVLKGRTENPAELDAAREAASKARGVTKVINQVKLGPREKELTLEDLFHSQVNNDREE